MNVTAIVEAVVMNTQDDTNQDLKIIYNYVLMNKTKIKYYSILVKNNVNFITYLSNMINV